MMLRDGIGEIKGEWKRERELDGEAKEGCTSLLKQELQNDWVRTIFVPSLWMGFRSKNSLVK